jgi:ParB-like chromosome segregation protein Spo0J
MKQPKPQTASGIPVHCRGCEIVDIADLKPYPGNPNKHGDEQIALLAKIIKARGWRHPIIVSKLSGRIVAGHGRLDAARLLQVAEVPVERQAFADEAAEHEFLLADNRIAELAERDNALVKDLLEQLDTGATDTDLTGYTREAIEELMNQYHVPDFQPVGEDQQGRLDQKKPVVCPKCGHEFTT